MQPSPKSESTFQLNLSFRSEADVACVQSPGAPAGFQASGSPRGLLATGFLSRLSPPSVQQGYEHKASQLHLQGEFSTFPEKQRPTLLAPPTKPSQEPTFPACLFLHAQPGLQRGRKQLNSASGHGRVRWVEWEGQCPLRWTGPGAPATLSSRSCWGLMIHQRLISQLTKGQLPLTRVSSVLSAPHLVPAPTQKAPQAAYGMISITEWQSECAAGAVEGTGLEWGIQGGAGLRCPPQPRSLSGEPTR